MDFVLGTRTACIGCGRKGRARNQAIEARSLVQLDAQVRQRQVLARVCMHATNTMHWWFSFTDKRGVSVATT